MNQSNENTKKLWLTLALLLIVIVLAVWMDHTSLPAFSESGEAGLQAVDCDKAATDSTAVSNTTAATTDETAETKTEPEIPEKSLTVSFLGECAPGSPYGTSAYGSLNAIAKENGSSYFFSEITSILSADDLTIAANRCEFSNSPVNTDALCAAPSDNISIYADGSVEIIANLSPDIRIFCIDAARACEESGIAIAERGTVHYMERNGIVIAILYEHIEKATDASKLASAVKSATGAADFVILYFSGGERDSHSVEPWLRSTLTSAVRAGASLIVGTGTNVLRPIETVEGVTVVYSLGSLVDGTKLIPENATAIAQLKLTKAEDGVLHHELSIIPVYAYSALWQPTLMTDARDKSLVDQFLNGEIPLPIKATTQ